MGISVPGYSGAGMRYKVIRTCYWQRRLWEKGEVVELGENVPEHFKPLTSTAARLAALKAEVEALRVPAQVEAAPAEAPAQEEVDEQATSLESMNVGQLQKLARENGLEPPKNATKKELISALRGE